MMNRFSGCIGLKLFLGAALLATVLLPSMVVARPEPKFEMLQIGTRTFTNVTVTSTNARAIFISHAGGLESVKLADVPPDLREKLGYSVPKPKTNAVASWTKSQVARFNADELEKVRAELEAKVPLPIIKRIPVDPTTVATVFGAGIAAWLLFSCCCVLICRKTGADSGFLAWVPLLQIVPLVRAAGMSPAWALAFLVPVLNLVAYVVWCLRISQARGKSPACAVALMLPLMNVVAFVYLALSAAAEKQDKSENPGRLITLKTA